MSLEIVRHKTTHRVQGIDYDTEKNEQVFNPLSDEEEELMLLNLDEIQELPEWPRVAEGRALINAELQDRDKTVKAILKVREADAAALPPEPPTG